MPSRPGLLLFVPGDWEADPPALAELRRHLSDEYGATLVIRQAAHPLLEPVPFYTGWWRARVTDELRHLIMAAFFSLDWLELEDVG